MLAVPYIKLAELSDRACSKGARGFCRCTGLTANIWQQKERLLRRIWLCMALYNDVCGPRRSAG